MTKEQIIEAIKAMTVLELNELVEACEEKFGVSAAAPVAVEEDLTDDLELVAVISAAIAAYEGSEDASGYVVRSIRKSTKWQRA